MKLTALILALGIIGSANAQETVAVGEPTTMSTPANAEELKAQVLLDRAHFSVGEIDSVVGSTTRSALKQFQQSRNLPTTGEFDQETFDALEDGQPITRQHTLSEADVSGPYGGNPRYRNKMEKLGEVFQSSPKLLQKLNPDASFEAGETIQVPNVGQPFPKGSIARIAVDTKAKTVKIYNASGTMMGYYPTTVGDDSSIPYGTWKIVSATKNPYYRRVMPDGKIKAMNGGPNNYVGNMWMALSAKHYGLHGSPEPSKIAKQQSAGCIRLTNWDANEVATAIVKKAVIVVE